jgi:hypothetical protein
MSKEYIAKKVDFNIDQEFSNLLQHKCNELFSEIIHNLSTYVYTIGEENVELHVKYPMDWWEAFKERWFSKWLLTKYPVRCKEINIVEKKYKAVCPHLIQEGKETHLKWMVSTVEWDDDE